VISTLSLCWTDADNSIYNDDPDELRRISSENVEEDGRDAGLESVQVVHHSTENVTNDLSHVQTAEEPNNEMRTEEEQKKKTIRKSMMIDLLISNQHWSLSLHAQHISLTVSQYFSWNWNFLLQFNSVYFNVIQSFVSPQINSYCFM